MAVLMSAARASTRGCSGQRLLGPEMLLLGMMADLWQNRQRFLELHLKDHRFEQHGVHRCAVVAVHIVGHMPFERVVFSSRSLILWNAC